MAVVILHVISAAVDSRIQRCDNLRFCSLKVVAILERILTSQTMYL